MNNKSQIAIKLTHVTKQYTIHHEKPTLVEKMVKGREEKFLALNNVSLEIKKEKKSALSVRMDRKKPHFFKTIAFSCE